MRALVTGATGQLGRALMSRLGDAVVWSGGRGELDIRDVEAVSRIVRDARPDVVFNAAAYNHVDGAESDPAQALAVNALGPAHLARACRAAGALLLHVSTDYVFDGEKREPYAEDDCPRPASVYGASKLAGEHLAACSGCASLVVRTSGVFGALGSRIKGGSFVDRALERARSGQTLKVVGDQVFSPTYAPDLASALVALIERGARGLVHVTNSGSCSWHGFASAVVKIVGLAAPVQEIRSRELGAPARRPAYSVLSTVRCRSLGLPALRPWEEALREFLGR